MKGGPDGSSASLKSKHKPKASAPSCKHVNSLQAAVQVDLGSSLEFNGHKNTSLSPASDKSEPSRPGSGVAWAAAAARGGSES